MTPRQQYINHVENNLCGDLMRHVVGEHPRTANSGPGQCDIAQVITLTKEALEAGQAATSHEDLREKIEFSRQTPGRGDSRIAPTMDSPCGSRRGTQ